MRRNRRIGSAARLTPVSRGRKPGAMSFVDKRNDFKNEVNSLLDRNGITYDGSLWTDEGREFLDELTLGEPSQLLLEKWLEAIDEFTEKITESQEKIEKVAVDVEEVDLLMTTPGIASYSGLMIHSEIGEVERFDRAAEVVSYAG